MLVRLTTGMSGPAFSLVRGDERDFPDAEAIRLVQAGYAVPVDPQQYEKAVKPTPAEKRQPKKPAMKKRG